MGLFANARTPHERRPQAAAKTGDVTALESSLQTWREDSSVSPPTAFDLHMAAGIAITNNQPEALAYLLDQGSSADNTLARQTAGKNGTECFNVLYGHGWRPESEPDGDAMPTIQMAIGNDEQLRWLLDHGADPNVACARTNDVPLSRAARRGNIQTVDLLLRHGAVLKDSNALHAAASQKGSDDEGIPMMQHLVNHSIDVNALEVRHTKRTGHNNGILGTALHSAIRADKPARVRWLLEHGANGKIKNERGYAPLEWATECESSSELVEVLRKAGCE
ncbi:hypothetical protein LTR17_003994 [Elasticomyces elasticus]|nr:hypothetical protein LTR17_003994 [Elasticomyces elasticus]